MFYIALLSAFLLGLSIVNFISREFSIYEKTGASFLLGIGVTTLVMFIYEIFNIPINLVSLLIFQVVAIAALNYKVLNNRELLKINLQKSDYIQFTFTWFFFAGLILYFLYGVIMKGIYWPSAEYDSLTGYDLMAKMIAREGTLNTSIFEYPRNSTYEVARFVYPPLTAGSFAYAYIFGMDSPKLMMILLFLSFLVSFYGLIRKTINDSWSILFTFLMMVTPEMFSHASLSLTNLPNAIYTSLAIISIIYWLEKKELRYFILSLLLLIISTWSRSDSIVFCAVIGLILLLHALKTKEWKLPIIYCFISVIPFIVWSVFVKLNIGANSADFFVKELFWDGEKFSMILKKCLTLILGNGMYYGITFYAFVIILALNSIEIFKTKNNFAIVTVTGWLLYTLLYYQMDYSFAGSVDAYINASYKRGMFNFIPLCWFFIATSPLSLKTIGKMDKFLFN